MLRALAALALIGLAVAGFAGWSVYQAFEEPGPTTAETRILIQRGDTPAAIAARLEASGVLEDAMVFQLLTRLEGQGGRIRAGEFLAPAGISPRELLTLLTEGPTIAHKLTVPEGATVVEALAVIAAAEGLTGDMPRPPPEGSLLPETYHYAWNDSRESVDDYWASWYLHSMDGDRFKLCPNYGNPVEKVVKALRVQAPDLTVEETGQKSTFD